MKKLIMWNVISLDGYFEGAKPWDLDFHQTAWGDDLQAYIVEQLATADTLIFGRRTYEGMADYWSKAKDQPEAQPMNEKPKIVCSTTLKSADWHNTTVIKDAAKEIAELKQQGDGNLFVFGSGNLSESLMKADLFDEYRLCVAPVFLGTGKRLFDEGIPYQKLQRLHEQTLQSGGVILTYAPLKH